MCLSITLKRNFLQYIPDLLHVKTKPLIPSLMPPRLASLTPPPYALAAPLSAPFVGGGLITLTLPLILERVPIGMAALALCAVVAGIFYTGLKLAREQPAVE